MRIGRGNEVVFANASGSSSMAFVGDHGRGCIAGAGGRRYRQRSEHPGAGEMQDE